MLNATCNAASGKQSGFLNASILGRRRKPSMCQLLERIKWLKPVFVQRRAKQPRHFYACCYLETTRVFHLEGLDNTVAALHRLPIGLVIFLAGEFAEA